MKEAMGNMHKWSIRSETMRCFEEKVTGEHLFYGLTSVGPTSSTHAAICFIEWPYLWEKVVINPGEMPEETCLAINVLQRFKATFSFVLVFKRHITWNEALSRRLFPYLSEYTNLQSHLTNIYFTSTSSGCKN